MITSIVIKLQFFLFQYLSKFSIHIFHLKSLVVRSSRFHSNSSKKPRNPDQERYREQNPTRPDKKKKKKSKRKDKRKDKCKFLPRKVRVRTTDVTYVQRLAPVATSSFNYFRAGRVIIFTEDIGACIRRLTKTSRRLPSASLLSCLPPPRETTPHV